MIVNLTPHPIRIYHPNVPDRIEVDGEHRPLHVLEPAGAPVRLVQDLVGCLAVGHDGDYVPVEYVSYGGVSDLPPLDADAWDSADATPRTWHVVPLVVALAVRGRPDLLVPYNEVRNLAGTVIGCRALARPC